MQDAGPWPRHRPPARVRSGLPRWTWPPEYKAALCMHLQSFQHPSSGLQVASSGLQAPHLPPPTPAPSSCSSLPAGPRPPSASPKHTTGAHKRVRRPCGAGTGCTANVCPLEAQNHLPAGPALPRTPAWQCPQSPLQQPRAPADPAAFDLPPTCPLPAPRAGVPPPLGPPPLPLPPAAAMAPSGRLLCLALAVAAIGARTAAADCSPGSVTLALTSAAVPAAAYPTCFARVDVAVNSACVVSVTPAAAAATWTYSALWSPVAVQDTNQQVGGRAGGWQLPPTTACVPASQHSATVAGCRPLGSLPSQHSQPSPTAYCLFLRPAPLSQASPCPLLL